MLLTEYHEDLEVDLLRYGLDLLDLYRADWDGTALLSLRRLDVITRRLLRDRTSALAAAIDPDATAWEPTAYVLADLIDFYQVANFKNPKPYPRPADVAREREFARERRAALEAQAERIRARQEAAEGAT